MGAHISRGLTLVKFVLVSDMTKKHTYRKHNPEYKEEVGTRLCAMKRRKVAQLSEAQGHRCCYCSDETFLLEPGDTLPKGMSWDQRATLEHLIPKCEPIQTNKDKNLVMACANCNTIRGLGDPMAFYEQIRLQPRKQIHKAPKPPYSAKKLRKMQLKQAKGLAICLVAAMLWPDDLAYWAENWKPPKKKVKHTKKRSHKIRKIAKRVTSDSRRLAA